MKKLLLLLFVFSGLALNAQENYENGENKSVRTEVVENSDLFKVETNRFGGNWFITVGGGAQMYFGDHNKQMKFTDRLTPAIDAGFGKWFTPGIGIRLMYSGYKAKGVTKMGSGAHNVSNQLYPGIDPKHNLVEQKFNYFHLHGDVMFNLTHLLLGYKDGGRTWGVIPYAGLGLARVYENPKVEEAVITIGLLNSFRISNAFDINLDVRGFMVNDRFDGEGGGRLQEGVLSATLGLSYRIGKKIWDRSKTVYVYDDTELNNLRRQFDELDAENQKLKEALAAGNQKEAETIIEKMQVAAPLLVTFKINKSDLSKEARVNLGMLAEIMKLSDEGTVYVISGFADKGTGNTTFNQKLSEARAQAVYDCLVNEFNVPAEKLTMEPQGGVDNMFYDDPRLSRAVITKAK